MRSCAVRLLLLFACCGLCAAVRAARPAILCWQGLGEAPPAKAWQAAGFQVVTEPLQNWRWDYLRQFNVILLNGPEAIPEAPKVYGAGADPISPDVRANLQRYVNEGGVLILSPNGYWATDVWVGRWNSIFGPLFGVEWLGEHPWDTSTNVPNTGNVFWTDNLLADHPAVTDIKRLYYTVPQLSDGGSPAPLWKETAGWQTLVRGMKTTVSTPTSGQGYRQDQPGSYASAPPLLSIKPVGKGYVVLDALLTSPPAAPARPFAMPACPPTSCRRSGRSCCAGCSAPPRLPRLSAAIRPPAR